MTKGSDTLYFTYDAAGRPMAFTHKTGNTETTYYYATNLQGDIIAILDDDGESVVEYTYDAWGNSLGIDPDENDPDAATLAALNPLRYRGYVYDSETGLYYLQSRYYNPEIGRFINGDVFCTTGQGFVGNNMFAYCLNSPVFTIDSDGKRTYFINGINNNSSSGTPSYATEFAAELETLGVKNVHTIGIYQQSGIIGGVGQVILEMLNLNIYTNYVVSYIENDLKQNPLEDGEQLNIIGYSGGGQIALNVMEKLSHPVTNVVLIGAPVAEIWKTSTKISAIYAGKDPLSWNIGYGYKSYFAGWIGHTDYFSEKFIKRTAEMVDNLID